MPLTYPASADLVEGTGNRSFSAVTTQAGDYLVVGIQVESGLTGNTFVPSCTGVTFPGSANVDSGTPSGSVGRALIWVGTDTTGGSRTVLITSTGSGGFNYRARVTVVRNSTGAGGTGASSSAQTVSVTRTGANSGVFMGVTDWSAGPVGSPSWIPGGSTTASQQGAAATYIFGRWDDSGSTGTANHGITTPTYTTPAVAVLEMKDAGGAAAAPPVSPAQPGRTWLRRFKHRQTIPPAPAAVAAAPVPVPPVRPVQARQLPTRGGIVESRTGPFAGTGSAVKAAEGPVRAQPAATRGGRVAARTGTLTVAAPQAGPRIYPLDHPVQARQLPARAGGVVQSRDGLFGGVGPALRALAGAVSARLRVLPPRGRNDGLTGPYGGVGPAVKPADGPVAPARTFPTRGGRVASRAGTFTSTAIVTGPPIYPTGHPVQARALPQRGGAATSRDGVFAGTGPAVKPLDGPVKAQPAPTRGGRVVARVGTLTVGGPQVGPPVYPTGHPAVARRLPTRGGTVSRRTGVYGGVGPPAVQLRQPIGRGRQQPPPPARGRTAALRGPVQGSGPPVRQLQRPIRSRLPGPVLVGRAQTTLLPAVATPPPPFSIGGITGGTATTASVGGGTSTTAGVAATTTASSSVAGGTSAAGGISGSTSPTGGP